MKNTPDQRRPGCCAIDLYDCPRFFSDWEKHIGTNGRALRAMLEDAESRRYVEAAFAKVKAYLRPRQADGFTEFLILIWCAWGKHRSVALATLLDCVLRRAGHNTVVEHLCRTKWSAFGCGTRWTCQECDLNHQSRHRYWAESEAWSWWLRAPEPRD